MEDQNFIEKSKARIAALEAVRDALARKLHDVHALVFNSQDQSHAELMKELAAWDAHHNADQNRITKLQKENARLRQALKDAPHGEMCATSPHVYSPPERRNICNCWKAALTRTPEAKP